MATDINPTVLEESTRWYLPDQPDEAIFGEYISPVASRFLVVITQHGRHQYHSYARMNVRLTLLARGAGHHCIAGPIQRFAHPAATS